MESGLLPAAEAKKVLEKKLQKTGKFSSPTKSAASTPRTASSTPRSTSSKSVVPEKKEVKKPASEALSGRKKGNDSKKRKKDSDSDSDDDDDDFVASRVSNKKARAK